MLVFVFSFQEVYCLQEQWASWQAQSCGDWRQTAGVGIA